jgi:arylsulfatase A-like enzyme
MTTRVDSQRTVNLIDLYPTLVDLCGLPKKTNLDGRSIAPLLRNPEMAWPYPSITINANGSACIRDERWYYIRYNDGTEEFYDMEKDPMQWANLAKSDNAEIVASKGRLAKSFPAVFAPDVKVADKDSEGKGPLDRTIRAARAKVNLQ